MFTSLAELDFAGFEEIFLSHEEEGRRAVKSAGVSVREIHISRALDMRYVGQEHLVTIDVPLECFAWKDKTEIKRLFDHEHERRYGTSVASEPAEIAGLRTAVTGVLKKPKFERIARGPELPQSSALRGTRQVYFAGGFVESAVFNRTALLAGNRIAGPAVIEEHASTTVLMPGDELEVDALGNYFRMYGNPFGPMQYDEFAHMTIQVLITPLIVWLLRERIERSGQQLSLGLTTFFAGTTIFGLSSFYEIIELWDEMYFGGQRIWGTRDTSTDLQFDLFGVVVGASLAYLLLRRASARFAQRQVPTSA